MPFFIFAKFSILLVSSSPNNYGLQTDFGWCPEADSGYEFTADVSSIYVQWNLGHDYKTD